jgi:hypothetical protein
MAASKHAIKSAVVIIAFLFVSARGFMHSEEIIPDTVHDCTLFALSGF